MIDWKAMIQEYGPAVWRTAYRLLGNPSDADECLQEAFVSALEVSRRGDVRNWGALLRKLAVLRGIDTLRRRASIAPGRLDEAQAAQLVSRETPPDLAAQNGELTVRLRRTLGRLSPRHAEAICLRYLNEMSYEEIAQELGLTVQHVGVVLSRAREELREMLSVKGADHG